MPKRTHAPDPDQVPSLESLGVELHSDTLLYVENGEALANALGGNGVKDIFANPIVLAAAFSACMGGLLFGFDQGILSVVLTTDQFLAQFPETDVTVTSGAGLNKGVMTALLELGAFIGALISGFFADRYSRKGSIAFGSIWFLVGSILQASSYSFAQLVVGRFIGGIGIGILSSTAPMYISEIAPPNVRGAFLVLEEMSIVIGIVSMFYITYGTRHIAGDWSFRLPFTIQMAPCLVLGAVLYRLPFSPRWLAQVGRDRDSLDSLSRLRRLPITDPRVQAEWITIRTEAIRSRDEMVRSHPTFRDAEGFKAELKLEVAGWIDMFKPGIINRTMIGVMLMFFQQVTGINAVSTGALIYYSPTLFDQLGLGYEMQLTMSGVLNVAQLVAVIASFFLLDKVGRRPPLIIGSILIASSHFIVAAMIGVYSHDWPAYPVQAWVGVGFIIAFMVFFGIGWAPIPWTMPAEVHSSSRRAKGVAITTCTNWFFNFVIGLITPPMIQNTRYGTFIFFGAFGVLSGIWAWFFAPETKGKTLEEIDALFHSRSAQEDAEAKRGIVVSIVGAAHALSIEGGGEFDKNVAGHEWLEKV